MEKEEIKEMRLHLKMSQEKFGRFVGVTGGTVNRWEKGTFSPCGLVKKKLSTMWGKYKKENEAIEKDAC